MRVLSLKYSFGHGSPRMYELAVKYSCAQEAESEQDKMGLTIFVGGRKQLVNYIEW